MSERGLRGALRRAPINTGGRHAPYIIQIPLYAGKLQGAILQKNYSASPGFNLLCSYLSLLLSIKMSPPPYPSLRLERYGHHREVGAGLVLGGAWWNSPIILHQLIVAIFSSFLSFSTDPPPQPTTVLFPLHTPTSETTNNLGNLLAYWHRVIRLKTTAASSWPLEMS